MTNPAQFREDGLLELRRRVDPNGPQHGCKVGCSPNMCKGAFRARTSIMDLGDPPCRMLIILSLFILTGAELEAFMERHGGWAAFDKVVYVGDGSNDLCPVLHLRECALSSLALSSPPIRLLTT